MNEIVLLIQVLIFYGGLLCMYRWCGSKGVLAWSILATVAANIECLIQIDAFGMSMTGGNILFASTFLATDIISEMYSKQKANKLVNISIITAVLFVVISQTWLFFQPNSADFAFPYVSGIFANVPRVMIASLITYAIVQKADIWLYHLIWKLTAKQAHDNKKFLWVRNNGATIISQFFNAILFNFGAFYMITPEYSVSYCWSISMATFVIYIVTSLIDTPFIYIARKIAQKGKIREIDF